MTDTHSRTDRAGNLPERFLAEISALMGLPAGSEWTLRGPVTFRSRVGFLCRLPFAHDGEVPAARPEILLPVTARTLTGPDIERLLALQQAMALEMGWVIGLSSEGRVQLSPFAWIDEPRAIVAALDLGQALGLRVLDELGSPPP